MFRTVPPSIIRSFSLYTKQWYVIQVCWQLVSSRIRMEPFLSWSCSLAVSKPLWHISLLCLQWKTPDDGQRNCPKHAEFYSKNKFEKSVHLVGFIIRIYHNARSPERQILAGDDTLITVQAYHIVHKAVSLKYLKCGSWNNAVSKVKFSLQYAMKAQRETRGMAPLSPNLGTRCRWMVTAMPQLFYPQEEGRVGPRARLDWFWWKETPCPCQVMNPGLSSP